VACATQDKQEEPLVSDQDFFFDDDEKPAAKSDSKAKPSGARGGSKGSSRPAPAPAAPSGQTVSMTLAILFAVIGLLAGMVIGLFIGNLTTPASTATVGTGATGAAPSLSEDQLQGGQLPAGHPSITGGAGSSSTATATK
jgi:hypothetical protein